MSIEFSLEDLKKDPSAIGKLLPYLLINPLLAAGWLLILYLREQGKITSDDTQNICEVIKAGADYGVDEMAITIEKENVLGVEAAIKDIKASRNFSTILGSKGNSKYVINVKYK